MASLSSRPLVTGRSVTRAPSELGVELMAAGGKAAASESAVDMVMAAAGPTHLRDDSQHPNDYYATLENPNVVSLDNVHKTYLLGIEGVPALRGVSLDIRRGEFVVILGKSGSGKTTMLNMIGTIDKPSRGDVVVCGMPVSRRTTDSQLADIRLNRLGFVFQTFNLLPSMTASENVQMPMVLAGQLSRSERKARARELLYKVGMGHRIDHYPSQLSGGEQQRVTIARALANHPEVLLLDEPTGDLDSKNSDIVMKLLTDLNRKERATLIMVTHDVALKMYANRVVHMLDGKINRIETIAPEVREGALKALNESRWVRALSAPLSAPGTFVDTSSGDAAHATASMTQVRKPLDYSTQVFAKRMGVPVDAAEDDVGGAGGSGCGAGAGSSRMVGAGAAAAGHATPEPVTAAAAAATHAAPPARLQAYEVPVAMPLSAEVTRWASSPTHAVSFPAQTVRPDTNGGDPAVAAPPPPGSVLSPAVPEPAANDSDVRASA